MSDVEIRLRIREGNLTALTVPVERVHLVSEMAKRGVYLVEVEPGVYRLGGVTEVDVPAPLEPIEVLREAGVATEVDELFLGGRAS